jgi:hypothetical protein
VWNTAPRGAPPAMKMPALGGERSKATTLSIRMRRAWPGSLVSGFLR